MLDTLLESKARRERSEAGVVLSVVAHTALIGAALYATTHAHPGRPRSLEIVRPIYFPQAPQAPRPQSSATNDGQSRLRPHFALPKIDISVPTVEIPPTLTRAADFSLRAITGPMGDEQMRGEPTRGDGVALLADQVERQVSLAPGSKPPRYPETLRAAGVEGRVVALFVVNDQGLVEEPSIRILRSDNPLFDDAVKSALGRMRFIPAESGGRKVRQLVQMPFVFTLAR
jgi:protein TonB